MDLVWVPASPPACAMLPQDSCVCVLLCVDVTTLQGAGLLNGDFPSCLPYRGVSLSGEPRIEETWRVERVRIAGNWL
jgi:hypothetical protein